ncbi:hypothetical protein MBLNU230_g3733t1 [Neophaeotheca triangularis]
MKLSTLLALPACLVSNILAHAAVSSSHDYQEHLHLKPLPKGALYAGFDFTASTPESAYLEQNFRYFPRSLGQILQYTHTQELHLRFALGRWDQELWGSRPRDGKREGGTGVELWAWVEGKDAQEAEERWGGLVNTLSGLFCASLNFIDSTKTTRPVMSFDPEGTLNHGKNGTLHLMHGTLPHEVVCTENLTPFLKMLPCKGKAGISSLLDGHKIFDANWQTMAVDVRPVCRSAKDCDIEVQQTVDIVLDVDRSMRPLSDPIPRPVGIEEIICDEKKPYNAHDSCYPKRFEGEKAWSISQVFGRPIQGSCALGDTRQPDITLEVPAEREVAVLDTTNSKIKTTVNDFSRTYRIPSTSDFDLSLTKQDTPLPANLPAPPLHASRQITGYGQERGGMHSTLRNPHPYPQHIIFLESLPWFLRPYIHTLQIHGGGTIEKMFYTPALDRRRGTQLELQLHIPAHSAVELTYDFEKAVLRYTEYPPDANRGFDVAPAVIRVLPRDNDDTASESEYLRTASLLLPLPTPDFSMPYNVIILTSTVIALGFGSIFNLLVRSFVLAEEVPVSPLVLGVRKIVGRAREVVRGFKVKSRVRVDGGIDSKEAEWSAGDGGKKTR